MFFITLGGANSGASGTLGFWEAMEEQRLTVTDSRSVFFDMQEIRGSDLVVHLLSPRSNHVFSRTVAEGAPDTADYRSSRFG